MSLISRFKEWFNSDDRRDMSERMEHVVVNARYKDVSYTVYTKNYIVLNGSLCDVHVKEVDGELYYSIRNFECEMPIHWSELDHLFEAICVIDALKEGEL